MITVNISRRVVTKRNVVSDRSFVAFVIRVYK